MSQSRQARAQARAGQRFAFRLHPLAAASALFILGTAQHASAQQADAAASAPVAGVQVAQAQTDQRAKADAEPAPISVVVSGIRRGIESAIAVKRDSSSIVETISAEDIGKLPDISIAESLARLPGLSAQRVNGQARSISIRGTTGDLSTALLNGREQTSTSNDRIVQYDQYPSELINQVTVYKTSDATVMNQGLSGTVDLQSVKPLQFAGRTITVNLRGERNSMGSIGAGAPSTGNRESFSYIDQFADRTVGVALGFARLDKPNASQQFETWNWIDNTSVVPGQTIKVPQGIKAINYTGNEVRQGAMAVLEFRPSKNFTSTIDLYHSQLDQDEIRRGVEIPMESWSGAFFSNPVVQNGLLVGGVVNATPVVRNNSYTVNDKLTSFGWNNKFKFDQWTTTFDYSYSSADHKEYLLELNSSRGAENIPFAYNGGDIPSYHLSANYADPSAVKLGGPYGIGYINAPIGHDVLHAYRLEAKRRLESDYFSDVVFGVNYSSREKTKVYLETSINANSTTIPGSVLNASQDMGAYGLPNILSWDPHALLAANFGPVNPQVLVPWGATKNWQIDEKITTAFAKLDIDSTAFSVPVKGNLGLQIVRTDQSSSSNVLINLPAPPWGALAPIVDGKTYTDVLPNLNLAFELSDNQVVRVAAGKALARPKLDQLNAAFAVGLTQGTTGTPNGNGGNAKLDPWRADAYDIAYEKYFGNKGYFSAAAFYKNLKSYIYNQTVPYDFSRFNLNLQGAVTNTGTFTQPVNGQGGRLDGLELALSLPLDMISPSLDGFGVIVNASFTDSSITIKDQRFANTDVPLPGLSKTVTNLTAYYEKNGFSTRVSARHRSDFVSEIGGVGGATELTYNKGENIVDFQAGYEFQTGSYKGLSVLFQVNNLNNSPLVTYSGSLDRPRGYQTYGRQMLLGLNYKM